MAPSIWHSDGSSLERGVNIVLTRDLDVGDGTLHAGDVVCLGGYEIDEVRDAVDVRVAPDLLLHRDYWEIVEDVGEIVERSRHGKRRARQFGYCRTCGGKYALHRSGVIWGHSAGFARCLGSGQKPREG